MSSSEAKHESLNSYFEEGLKCISKEKGMEAVKSVSGNDIIKKLTKIGFRFVKQRGSHVKLKRIASEGTRTVIVPLHKDLPDGTLHSISRQAGLSFKEFENLFNKN